MCVSSRSERSCSSRFNQRVYHDVFLSLFLSYCSYALLLRFFSLLLLLLLDLFVCVCVCVGVSQNEDQHNVFDVYLFFSSLLVWFALTSFFSLSHYILTYLKYTLNSLYKQIEK